jgi:hypothetical protein
VNHWMGPLPRSPSVGRGQVEVWCVRGEKIGPPRVADYWPISGVPSLINTAGHSALGPILRTCRLVTVPSGYTSCILTRSNEHTTDRFRRLWDASHRGRSIRPITSMPPPLATILVSSGSHRTWASVLVLAHPLSNRPSTVGRQWLAASSTHHHRGPFSNFNFFNLF